MNDKILELARKRFTAHEEAEKDIRALSLDDFRFVDVEQWSDKDRKERERMGRPALTFNRLPTFVHQVANEARNNKPSVKFSPVDGQGDKDTAEVFEGLARHIQYASHADVAYETALVHSAKGGFGYFRLLADYVDDQSFDQELRFAPVMDPFSVYGVLVPACYGQAPESAFVVEDLSEDEYHARYPLSKLASLSWEQAGQLNDWITNKRVRVAEYWYKEPKRRKMQFLADFSRRWSDDPIPPGRMAPVIKERSVLQWTIKSCVTNGYEILPDTETEWLGKRIPIFCALGDVQIVDGRPRVSGIIRWMKDPARLINFYKSGIAEAVALGNRVPYIGYKGQFTDPKWKNANTVNYPYLEAEPTLVNGVLAPLPQRQSFEPAIQALSLASAQEVDDLKSIAGIFDASLGQEANAKSGIALSRQQRQSSITNLHFNDNLGRAQEDAGEELGVTIPLYYDTPREVRIVGEDETEKVVKVNQPGVDEKTGEPTNYMLDAGKYDVVVKIGPAYNTKRQEGFDALLQMSQANPMVLQIGGDIIFRNSDIPGADELAERWKKTLPPGLAEQDQAQQQIPPQVQQQMMMLSQQHEMLVNQLQTVTQEMESKAAELASRERIAAMQEETKRAIGLATIDTTNSIALLRAEVEAAHRAVDHDHSLEAKGMDQQHAADMKAVDQQHATEMQGREQEAALQAQEQQEPAEPEGE